MTRRFVARGAGGNGNLVARQPLERKIRHLSNLLLRVVECGDQSRDHFLGSQVFQTENGVHTIGRLGRVQIVKKRLEVCVS